MRIIISSLFVFLALGCGEAIVVDVPSDSQNDENVDDTHDQLFEDFKEYGEVPLGGFKSGLYRTPNNGPKNDAGRTLAFDIAVPADVGTPQFLFMIDPNDEPVRYHVELFMRHHLSAPGYYGELIAEDKPEPSRLAYMSAPLEADSYRLFVTADNGQDWTDIGRFVRFRVHFELDEAVGF